MKKSKFSFRVVKSEFVKSSWSKNNPQTCVMVAKKPEGVALQDSKDLQSPTLFFTHEEWAAFKQGVASGEF